MRKIFIPSVMVFIMTFTCSSSYAGWLIYHKPAFSGKIIDAETKEPIEGAVVVAIYQKDPIISGPGGGSPSIIKVKEALTDKNGKFSISAYTTLIKPLSLENRVDFIIYKPGYGSWPGRSIYPFDFVGPEYLFTRPFGTQQEITAWGKTATITYGIAELPPLKTWQERKKASPSPVGEPSDWKEQKELIKLIRQEWQYIYHRDPRNLYKIEGE